MPALKDRWPGHPSIPLRVFGPSQYLVMLPVQLTRPKPKLMVTLKPLPAGVASKLAPPETQSDAEEQQCRQVINGGEVRRTEGTGATPINNFVHWFKVISTNMNPEAQRRALAASRKAASSVFTDAGVDEADSIAVKTAPALDVRKVEYSTEMAAVGFAPQNTDDKCPSED